MKSANCAGVCRHSKLGFVSIFFLSCLAMLPAARAADQAANIVSIQGGGEFKQDGAANWQPAHLQQGLSAGSYVKTGELARMGLLFKDRTQLRLSEKTTLQIKNADDQPRLRLDQGRAWTQTKTLSGKLYMETPSATAAIRGTDWDIEVDEKGKSLITVLSGEIEFSNEFGSVTIGRFESAEAEVGKAPTKLILVRPKDRVQWVSSVSFEPLRHISLSGVSDIAALRQRLAQTSEPEQKALLLADLGNWNEAETILQPLAESPNPSFDALLGAGYVALHKGDRDRAAGLFERAATIRPEPTELLQLGQASLAGLSADFGKSHALLTRLTRSDTLSQPAAYLVLSDLFLATGDLPKAQDQLVQSETRFPANPRVLARLSEVRLMQDERDEALAALKKAQEIQPESFEAKLTEGRLNYIEGNYQAATGAYEKAIALKPEDDRGWFGKGRLLSEKEEIRQGRKYLDQAIALNPQVPAYLGEKGTLETFANNFPAAQQAFEQELAAKPDDYVGLTGRGLMELKRGKTEVAMDDFLKSSLMEPGFARSHVYMAIAYYQTGNIKQALEELQKASELDDKDPLPHQLASIIYNDLLRPGEAVESARTALKLMPNLKSLNQIASNQRGTTNLGQAFAFFGMEEWAQRYAQDSDNPFWAGSHLFLADRYQGLYSKNSELFQGFLSDPTAFGNSNRFQTLVQKPGNYFTGSMRYSAADDFHGNSPFLQVNGFDNSVMPVAYFANHERFDLDFDTGPADFIYNTLALGALPREDFGIFLLASDNSEDSGLKDSGLDIDEELDTTNVDLGFKYKWSTDSQFWFKAARFHSDDDIDGTQEQGADTLPITAETEVDIEEYTFRHSFDATDRHEVTWGVEYARRKTDASFDVDRSQFFVAPFNSVIFTQDLDFKETSLDIYVSDRWKITPNWLVQGDLFYQKHHRKAHYLDDIWVNGAPFPGFAVTSGEKFDSGKLRPRLGTVVKLSPDSNLRLVYQDWMRPSLNSSLSPVATAGIPIDDRLVQRGGELQRTRAQLEWEFSPKSFVVGHLDHKRIEHEFFSLEPFTFSDNENLSRLTTRDLGALSRDDLLEFNLTPNFQKGEINSGGIAFNHLLTREWGVYARYVYTDSKNTGDLSPGNKLPYLPRHATALGATWVSPDGWYFITRVTHRTERFTDEANTSKLHAGWDGAFDLYRESRDKRWLFRVSADDALSRDKPTQYTMEVSLRF